MVFFSENTNSKKFLPQGVYSPLPCERSIAPIYAKIIYDLTIAIIDKFFEFENDWIKIIRIKYKGTQFCPIPLC